MPYKDPDQQADYQRRWMLARRQEWLQANGPCVDCDSWERLEVDHEVASEKVTHRIWSWSQARREAELAKCVVRCHDCHFAKTLAAKERPRGEEQTQSKLTADDVRKILGLSAEGKSRRVVAQRFGVSKTLVQDIVTGRKWAHIQSRG